MSCFTRIIISSIFDQKMLNILNSAYSEFCDVRQRMDVK